MSPLSRVLLFLMIGLAVAIAGLWISGGKKEDYSGKIEINARTSQVFPYLVEPGRLKEWMSGLEEMDRPVPPKEGYSDPPDLIRTVVDPNGKRVRYNDLVIRYTENEILTVQSSASGEVQTTIFQLEPIEGKKTQFSYYLKVSHSGLARLLAPIRSSDFQSRINTDVRKLKELVEKNEPQLPDEPEVPAEANSLTEPQNQAPPDVSENETTSKDS